MKRILSLILLAGQLVFGAPASQLSQYGITWTFDKAYEVGTFANGDYWVLGPVTITAITPDFDGTHNGWEVNPTIGRQGLEEAVGQFDAGLVPSLPYTASGGQSLIKGISLPNPGYPACLQTAAVLTVVAAIPPDSGKTVFRPPYAGTDKPYYSVSDLHTGLLPRHTPPVNAQTLSWVEGKYQRPQLEYGTGVAGRILRPIDNYQLSDPYGSHVGRDLADATLTLMLDYTVAQKRQALICYIQGGIDRFHCDVLGQLWGSGGGYQPNVRLPLIFTAVLLDNQAMKDSASHTYTFDDYMIYEGKNGTVLYGPPASETQYWNYFINPPNYNLEYADPYGYIDCGMNRVELQDGYQLCCLSMPWKGMAMAMYLMPELQPVFSDTLFLKYIDRWVEVGTWTQPDPCAPAEGIWHGGAKHGQRCTCAEDLPGDGDTCFIDQAKNQVTYGPDPAHPGDCIRDDDPSDGIGRFPNRHGLSPNSGGYGSSFIDAVYNAYRYPDGPVTVIVDNVDAQVTGAWSASTSDPGYYGTNYLSDGNSGKGQKSVTFTPDLPSAGTYAVYLRWPTNAQFRSWADDVPVIINHAGVSDTVRVDISGSTAGSQWSVLGKVRYAFDQGTTGNVVVTNLGTSKTVLVDAVKFNRLDTASTFVQDRRLNPPVGGTTIGLANNPLRLHAGGALRLAYETGTATSMRVTVHDPSGRMVRELFAGEPIAGHQTIIWDGRDRNGVFMRGGIYHILSVIDGRPLIRKAMLLEW